MILTLSMHSHLGKESQLSARDPGCYQCDFGHIPACPEVCAYQSVHEVDICVHWPKDNA